MKKTIIIYGAGNYGKRLLYFMKSINATVNYFCQTNCKEGVFCEEVAVINLEQLSQIVGTLIVLIAVEDDRTGNWMKGALLNLNRSDVRIYECGDFIKKNIPDITVKNNLYCNICGKEVDKFGPAVWPGDELFSKYHVIGGGGTRDNIYCPVCRSTARNRWQYWVLGKHTNLFRIRCSVLHIAPEQGISERINANPLCDYYTGNITFNSRSMHIVDITEIQFKNDFFDYIIMNHVLEHVENEAKAIAELKRVLKPDGKLILSFPICTDMDTYENPNVHTPEERLKEYGQNDHVRLYGRDYGDILRNYGLHVNVYSPENECREDEIIKYGFASDDVMLICEIVSKR